MNMWEAEHQAKHGSPAKVEAAPVTATAAAPAVEPVVASAPAPEVVAPEKPKSFLEKLKDQLAELEQEAVDEAKKEVEKL